MVLDIDEAITRLADLVKAVEENGEVVTLCRAGVPVVELHQPVRRVKRKFEVDPELAVKFAPGFDPRNLPARRSGQRDRIDPNLGLLKPEYFLPY